MTAWLPRPSQLFGYFFLLTDLVSGTGALRTIHHSASGAPSPEWSELRRHSKVKCVHSFIRLKKTRWNGDRKLIISAKAELPAVIWPVLSKTWKPVAIKSQSANKNVNVINLKRGRFNIYSAQNKKKLSHWGLSSIAGCPIARVSYKLTNWPQLAPNLSDDQLLHTQHGNRIYLCDINH